MPSAALDLNQMCQAVQASGYSPALSRTDDYDLARWILFSANQSGMSPVVIRATLELLPLGEDSVIWPGRECGTDRGKYRGP